MYVSKSQLYIPDSKRHLDIYNSRNQRRMCASCRRGEIDDEPAEYYVTGIIDEHPFRGYLCESHLEMYLNDGWPIKYLTLIGSDEWYKLMGDLTREYTGYHGFGDMCTFTPTLRTERTMTAEQRADIATLRAGYQAVTGKKAYD